MHKQTSRPIRPRTIIIAFLAFVVIIILLSVLGLLLRSDDEITITNPDGYNSALISESDFSRLKKELFTTIKTVTEEDPRHIDVYVRWDTLQKSATNATFLIDVDAFEQTYLVTLDPYNVKISCPSPADSKYPASFCIGNDGEYNDSISAVFGDELPLTSTTSAGETFEIVRAEPTGGTWSRDLAIWIFSCPSESTQSATPVNSTESTSPAASVNSTASPVSSRDALTSRVSSAVDALISSRGASPSAFTKKFYYMPCNAE